MIVKKMEIYLSLPKNIRDEKDKYFGVDDYWYKEMIKYYVIYIMKR